MCLTMKDNGIGSQSHNEHQLVNQLTDEYLVCQGLHENFLNKFFDKQDFGRHHFFFYQQPYKLNQFPVTVPYFLQQNYAFLNNNQVLNTNMPDFGYTCTIVQRFSSLTHINNCLGLSIQVEKKQDMYLL